MRESSDKIKVLDKSKKSAKTKEWLSNSWKTAGKHLPAWIRDFNDPKWHRWALLVSTSVVAAFMMAPKSFQVYSLVVGEPAKETIISPITFKVIDEAATNKNLDEVIKSVRPVYDFDDEMVEEVQARVISAFSFMTDYLGAEAEFKARQAEASKESTPGEAPPQDPAKPPFRILDDNTLRTRFENLLGTNIQPAAFLVLKGSGFAPRIQRDLRSLVVPVLMKGVVQNRELVMRDGKNGILLRVKSKDKLEQLRDLSAIFDLNEAVNFIYAEEKDSTLDPAVSQVIRRIARDLVNVNINFNRERSAALKQEALAKEKPVYFQIGKGEAIIREGDPVNEGHLRKLAGLNKADPAYSRYMILFGLSLFLVLVLRFSFYFSEKHFEHRNYGTKDLFLFCSMLVGSIVMVRFIYSFAPLMGTTYESVGSRSILYAAPIATAPMLIALMVDARIAFIFSALIGLTAALAVEGDIYLFAFYFVSGIVGLHGMSKITDRTSVMRAALVVGLVNMLSVLAIKMANGQLTTRAEFYEVGLGFLGGVLSGLLVSGLAPLLEGLGYTTNIKLLELANFNHPLLREMSLEAPGTYHHSIMVGNLAAAAAEQIGANPLLARVGAYYHDIGKVGKKSMPSYFIENQGRAFNPHDKLEPSMSALILVSHVKHGVEKSKDFRLGTAIIDIIQQHHGTNLIKFFYAKAVEKSEKLHQTVSEDKYRYPGPKPQSKEAALVMLADVVEAACRTLTEPTPARIQKRVQTLIMGVFTEGQLDQSTLTLKDLHAITKSFVRSMQAMMHSRIDYPGEQGSQERPNGDNHRQQTEKDRSRPGKPADEVGTNIKRLGL